MQNLKGNVLPFFFFFFKYVHARGGREIKCASTLGSIHGRFNGSKLPKHLFIIFGLGYYIYQTSLISFCYSSIYLHYVLSYFAFGAVDVEAVLHFLY
jgi:hypothetical protein